MPSSSLMVVVTDLAVELRDGAGPPPPWGLVMAKVNVSPGLVQGVLHRGHGHRLVGRIRRRERQRARLSGVVVSRPSSVPSEVA